VNKELKKMIGHRRIDAAQEEPLFYKPPYVTNKEARLSIENKKKTLHRIGYFVKAAQLQTNL